MIIWGDSLEILKTLDADSVDAVVTDPPYGWSFMNKAWDAFTMEKRRQQEFNRPPRKDGKSRGQGDPSLCAGMYNQLLEGNRAFQQFSEAWSKEVFRVLKPGGHALIFCGPRTYHRMASGVEDAGFEIRDQLQWIFGSGFPKSQNVALAIDKQSGAIGHRGKAFNTSGAGSRQKDLAGTNGHGEPAYSEPKTDDAKQWQGWGTALKPANEPIVLARKPLEKGLTVAENVLKWGTGAINVDASRIGSEPRLNPSASENKIYGQFQGRETQGRWPANLLLDETAARMLDEQSLENVKMHHAGNKSGGKRKDKDAGHQLFNLGNGVSHVFQDKTLGASRFFYCAKASKSERNAGLEGMPEVWRDTLQNVPHEFKSDGREARKSGSANQNFHPTVKPIKLMEYLIRLITPPGGVVLDPFAGSGSTLVAAKNLGFKFIGIEMNAEYVEIAKKRVE